MNNESNFKDCSNYVFHPIINGLQKMALYKTRSFFYIIGSDITQSKFRVLKVDRTEPTELVLAEDKVEYTQKEIKALIATINDGNRAPGRLSGGVSRSASAFGILGFIRFWEGYYIILITKRRKVAVIGYHSIYKIEDTSMLYVPHESVRIPHDDELKYVRLFNNIDLTSNFYFSYSYDLTNSLQYNLTPFKDVTLGDQDYIYEGFMRLSSAERDKFSDKKFMFHCPGPETKHVHNVAYMNKQKEKFIWNMHLLRPMKDHIHPAWFIPVIHGFITQSNICIYGRSLLLTLIARRSAYYAGTRFLKRGTNFEGDVANEVETEQMLLDSHISSLQHGRFSSFVQIRGSIPCHWSQDVSKMVPKPPIIIDLPDPYATAASKHFNQLMARFGSPIIVLNLVKRREKKPHESILNEEYRRILRQLNLTLPPQHRIQHIAVDMARINKDKEENVMSHLAEIAYKVVRSTGIFFNKAPYQGIQLNSDVHYKKLEKTTTAGDKQFGDSSLCEDISAGRNQKGIVRVNCVDCLDRTNTAQFALGKCVLGFQLHAFGVLDTPVVEFDSDCVRMLEEMYEDHGDTLALQYGGSQLVHRIETYRKTAPWTSQGSDLMQSFSRYYSNTFSDQEKQNAINLFLGVFVPSVSNYPIWDLASDYVLHQSLARDLWPCRPARSAQWWDDKVMEYLPLPVDQTTKIPEIAVLVPSADSKVDLFDEHHRPFELGDLAESFHFNMPHSVRDYMPNFTNDESPFRVRRRPGKKHEDVSASKRKTCDENPTDPSMKGPSMSGQPSTNSTSSGTSTSESELSDSEWLSPSEAERVSSPIENNSSPYSYNVYFPPAEDSYGTLVSNPSTQDMEICKKFVHLERFHIDKDSSNTELLPTSADKDFRFSSMIRFQKDKSEPFNLFTPIDVEKYHSFVKSAKQEGPPPPDNAALLKYGEYAAI